MHLQSSNLSAIATSDQHFLKIQDDIQRRTQSLIKNYAECLNNVKHNPYLQMVIDEHKLFFQNMKKNILRQIKALQRVLKYVTDKEHKSQIKNEIKDLAKKLKMFTPIRT
jgi:DNA-binding transcriptional regulator GbsR (MarR family)